MKKTVRKLDAALEQVRVWLLAPQHPKAIMSHFGGGTECVVGKRQAYIQCAPRGDAGAWLCLNLRHYYKVVKRPKTCPTCKHQTPEVTETRPWTDTEREQVTAAIQQAFGFDAIASQWGGAEFLSFDIKAKCGKDVQDMIDRYQDGCPQCKSVFCGTANHEWKKGFATAKDIDDVHE